MMNFWEIWHTIRKSSIIFFVDALYKIINMNLKGRYVDKIDKILTQWHTEKKNPALIAGLVPARFFMLWGQDFPALRARKPVI